MTWCSRFVSRPADSRFFEPASRLFSAKNPCGFRSAAIPPCRLSLVTKSAIVPLTAAYEPSQERYDAMRDAVLDAVLTKKTRPAAVDPIHMLVKDGRILDAVSMLRVREGIDLKTAMARVKELQKAQDA